MKHRCFKHGAFLLACVVIAGCSSSGFSPGQGASAIAPSAATRTLSLTVAHYLQPVVRTDFGKSWMLPQKKKSILIYAAGLVPRWGYGQRHHVLALSARRQTVQDLQ